MGMMDMSGGGEGNGERGSEIDASTVCAKSIMSHWVYCPSL